MRVRSSSGARIKNMNSKLKEEILNPQNYQQITPGYKITSFTYGGKKLMVSYGVKRSIKDRSDREKR